MKKNIFTKHPKEVGMNYFEHLCFALMLARKMSFAVFASLIHAFLPFLFTTYTSDTIKKLYEIFLNRTNIYNNKNKINYEYKTRF
ncbi:MAG: DUF6356 family protein [Bacteroidales bacterium]